MVLTVATTIPAISNYTVGDTGDITTTELALLQEVVAGELDRLNPGFTGDDAVLLETYLVLDKYENRGGTGVRTMEKIKDNQYTIRAPASSSYWMDCALKMIDDYYISKNNGSDFSGVIRSDTDMTVFSDGSNDPYIDPYDPYNPK